MSYVFLCAGCFVLVGAATGAPVQLTVATHWSAGKHLELLQQYIAEYNAMQSDVVLGHVQSGGFADAVNEQFLVAAASGVAPDIVHIPTSGILRYAELGFLIPPPAAVAARLELSFLPGARSLTTVKGVFYGPPTENMMHALALNRSVFERAGLLPEAPKTWDDLGAVARKIRRISADRRVEVAGVIIIPRRATFSMGWSNGGDLVDADGENVTLNTLPWRETFQFFRTLIADQSGVIEGTGLDFQMDQAGMLLGVAPWMRGGYIAARGAEWYDQLSSAPMPAGRTGRLTSEQYGYVLTVSSSSKHPVEAWKFITWLATERTRRGTTRMGDVMASLGSIPVTPDDLRNQPIVKENFLRGFMQIVSEGYTRTTTEVPPLNIIATTVDIMTPALSGQASVESALEKLQRELQVRMDEYVAQQSR